MKNLFLVLVLICQFLSFAQEADVPEINPKSTLLEVNQYYDFVLNINGEISDNKLDVFRKALAKYTPMEIEESGLFDKALNVSINEYFKIINSSRYSQSDFFKSLSLKELAKYTLMLSEEKFKKMLELGNYKTALDSLDPIGQVRKHNVKKLIKVVLKLSKDQNKDRLVKRKTFLLFSKYSIIESPELFAEIADIDLVRSYPRRYLEALGRYGNETPKSAGLILEYFQGPMKTKVIDEEIRLFTRLVLEQPEEIRTLVKKKPTMFNDYIDINLEHLYEEFGGMDMSHWAYEGFYYDALNIADEFKNLIAPDKELRTAFLNYQYDGIADQDFDFIYKHVVNGLIKSKHTDQSIAHEVFKAFENVRAINTNKSKYNVIKLLKEKNKLPPIKEIKNTEFYKTLQKSSLYKFKLWLLSDPCGGLFKA